MGQKGMGYGTGGGNGITQAAPLATGVYRPRFFGLKFDRAAPHDEFPEGGLRVSGCLPYPTTLTEEKSYFGAFGAGTAAVGVNPCGSNVTGNLLGMIAAGSPLAVFAQYFRRYRCRKLEAEFESMVMPGVVLSDSGAGDILQVSYERDPVTAQETSATYTQDSAVTNDSTRFTVWESRVGIPLITQKKISPSDELFFCTGAGDVITGTNNAELRQVFQGAVTAVNSAEVSATPINIGKILWHFEFDLYGFTNVITGLLPLMRRGLSSLRPISGAENKEEKDFRPRPARHPADLDYVQVDEDASEPASRSVALRATLKRDEPSPGFVPVLARR
jgi:hypothetical protein